MSEKNYIPTLQVCEYPYYIKVYILLFFLKYNIIIKVYFGSIQSLYLQSV